MLDWVRRKIFGSDDDPRGLFFRKIDSLNAEAGGGRPVTVKMKLGRLGIPSGAVVLGDPMVMPGLVVPGFRCADLEISASLWRYPSGMVTVLSLTIDSGAASAAGTTRMLGSVNIDSAKLVVADQADFNGHWTETGGDRIGVFPSGGDGTLVRKLSKRFGFKTRRVNPIRMVVTDPVSEKLESEIEAFLKADPKYADYPYMHFYVLTNNSFDRVNFMDDAWRFLPVGNEPEPLMFACGTGRGDGTYEVMGRFDGEIPTRLDITFIED